jgi:hypothetical protein
MFKKELWHFAGQRFKLSTCNPSSVEELRIDMYLTEPNLAVQSLRSILTTAGWTFERWRSGAVRDFPAPTWGCNDRGVLIGIGMNASSETRDAACALQRTIDKALQQKVPDTVTTCWAGTPAQEKHPLLKLGDDEINIEAGPHPFFPGDPNKTELQ